MSKKNPSEDPLSGLTNEELGLPFHDEELLKYLEHDSGEMTKAALDPRSRFEKAASGVRRSMLGVKPNEPFDEYISIDSTISSGSTAKFEYVADTLFHVERLYFDEPIRGVFVRMRTSRMKQFTRHIPVSWFSGVGKDGKLGQSLNQFRPLDLGGAFLMEFDNQTHASVRIVGVLAGTMVGYKQ